jgi:hypothetical protein
VKEKVDIPINDRTQLEFDKLLLLLLLLFLMEVASGKTQFDNFTNLAIIY